MADRNIVLNGEDVELKDVSTPGYKQPASGFVIELTTDDTRKFIKTGELAEVKSRIDSLLERKSLLQYRIDQNNDRNTSMRTEIDKINADVTGFRAVRDEINAFLDEVEA